MKISIDNFKYRTCFGDLKGGETFYYEPSGIIWMKLQEQEFLYNSAVALDDGTVCQFADDEYVIKVDIECEITLHSKSD